MTDRVPTASPDAGRLGRLNVRYVLTNDSLAGPDFRQVLEGTPSVYENLHWLPRVRVDPGGEASVISRRAGEYKVAVNAEHSVRMVLSETWLPGWQATVDGSRRRVERVEGALIGVSLDPGEHLVHLWYGPIGWRIGWPVSAGALAGLAIWTVGASRTAASRRSKVSKPSEP